MNRRIYSEEAADYIFEVERDERILRDARERSILRLMAALAHMTHEAQLRTVCAYLGTSSIERLADTCEHERRVNL